MPNALLNDIVGINSTANPDEEVTEHSQDVTKQSEDVSKEKQSGKKRTIPV